MRAVEVGFNTVLQIPDGWDAFIYRGYLYALIEDKFVCVEKLPT